MAPTFQVVIDTTILEVEVADNNGINTNHGNNSLHGNLFLTLILHKPNGTTKPPQPDLLRSRLKRTTFNANRLTPTNIKVTLHNIDLIHPNTSWYFDFIATSHITST